MVADLFRVRAPAPAFLSEPASAKTALFAFLLFSVVGCRSEHPTPVPLAPTPVVRHIAIPAGTPVKLVLFDELTSGGSDKGILVRLALAEPIDGLSAMTPATAVVSESRTEGTLGGLMNRPARLNLSLGSLQGPSGESIPLSADPKEPKDFELNRTNTGRPNAPQKEPEEVDVSAGVAIQTLVQKGESGGLNPKEVGDLARRLGMGETAKLADAGRLDEASRLVRTVRQGGTVAGLASGGTVAAALELVNFAGDVGHRLSRTLGGRNIRAYPGTIVQAYVLHDTTVTLRP